MLDGYRYPSVDLYPYIDYLEGISVVSFGKFDRSLINYPIIDLVGVLSQKINSDS